MRRPPGQPPPPLPCIAVLQSFPPRSAPPWPRGLSGRCSAPLWHSCMRGARLAGAALGPVLVRHPSTALSAGDRGVQHIGVCLSQGAVLVPEQPHLREGCAAHPTPAVGAVRGPGGTEAHCVPHSPGVGRVPSWRRGSSGPWQRRIPRSEGEHWILPGLSGSPSASDHRTLQALGAPWRPAPRLAALHDHRHSEGPGCDWLPTNNPPGSWAAIGCRSIPTHQSRAVTGCAVTAPPDPAAPGGFGLAVI